VSHALEMTINFYYPTLELFSFSFTQNFVYPTLFSSVPLPAINNDRSLNHSKLQLLCTRIIFYKKIFRRCFWLGLKIISNFPFKIPISIQNPVSYLSLTPVCTDTLLNVFLAIAVDNLATAQALTRDEEREQRERDLAKKRIQEKRQKGWLKAKKQLPIVLTFKYLSNLRNAR
jgi:hypothetical protein